MKARPPKSSNDARALWKQEHARCFWPGCQKGIRDGLECHEIIGGSDRAKTILMPAFWLLLCREHHDQLPSRPSQNCLVSQLAVKLWADPLRYNSQQVIKLWRPHATDGFINEVIEAIITEYRRIAKEYT